jgi:hypothetical protein
MSVVPWGGSRSTDSSCECNPQKKQGLVRVVAVQEKCWFSSSMADDLLSLCFAEFKPDAGGEKLK